MVKGLDLFSASISLPGSRFEIDDVLHLGLQVGQPVERHRIGEAGPATVEHDQTPDARQSSALTGELGNGPERLDVVDPALDLDDVELALAETSKCDHDYRDEDAEHLRAFGFSRALAITISCPNHCKAAVDRSRRAAYFRRQGEGAGAAMTRMRRRFAISLSGALLGGLMTVPLLSDTAVAGSPRTVPIGVDHSTPRGHNFEYVDYFPRSGVTVHSGDVLDFGWASTPDGLHTATLLQSGESPALGWANNPLVVPDSDDPSGQLEFNPTILGPTHPPAGSPAPGACGDAANPCVFDGTSELNSGANPTDGTRHFSVRVTAAPGAYSYICLIHPGMVGSFEVVGPAGHASTPGHVRAAARKQAKRDTKGALEAEEAVPPAQAQQNPDGTHTVTVTAGAATPYVEIAEMLPQNTTVRAGDTVNWVTKTIKDPHTVTFPQGDNPSTEPIPNFCEGTPDVLQIGPPAAPPCGDPTAFEIHFNPAPFGGTVISSPATVATSGIISNPPAPFPTNFSFSFPNTGTFTYMCRIHDHMTGTIHVRPLGSQQENDD